MGKNKGKNNGVSAVRKKYNPVVQARKIDKLREDIKKHSNVLKTVTTSYEKHMEHLANFANHDMKNTILSMDGVLFVNDYDNLTEESWDTLKTCLYNIKSTFDNFTQLVPYSTNKTFELSRLFVALNLLVKEPIRAKSVDFRCNYPLSPEKKTTLPFQTVLQMLHNLLLNSLNSLNELNPIIVLECQQNESEIIIKISDNGQAIEKKNKSRVFEHGYSTTGGTGIGLFHAKYVCEKLKGEIKLEIMPNEDINKIFTITLPHSKKEND